MRASEHLLPTGGSAGHGREERVDRRADLVGSAVKQLGVILALAIAVHSTCGLLFRP
jgi:hypothetical protein